MHTEPRLLTNQLELDAAMLPLRFVYQYVKNVTGQLKSAMQLQLK